VDHCRFGYNTKSSHPPPKQKNTNSYQQPNFTYVVRYSAIPTSTRNSGHYKTNKLLRCTSPPPPPRDNRYLSIISSSANQKHSFSFIPRTSEPAAYMVSTHLWCKERSFWREAATGAGPKPVYASHPSLFEIINEILRRSKVPSLCVAMFVGVVFVFFRSLCQWVIVVLSVSVVKNCTPYLYMDYSHIWLNSFMTIFNTFFLWMIAN
jgi:hypothetical protein